MRRFHAWGARYMSYAFPSKLQQLIQDELATGNYVNEDDVLLHAMTALREREESLKLWQAEIQDRIGSLDRGEGIELQNEQALRAFVDEVKSQGRALLWHGLPTVPPARPKVSSSVATANAD
jgi:Arc/MetJ-type ribon-helix-helix transcriptional regulator